MARGRIIKPEFWSDEKTGFLSPIEKCLFIGMWNFADDEGLIKSNPLYLKASIFPYSPEIEKEHIENALSRLQENSLIFLYKRNGQQYAWIIKFRIHQRIDKPQAPQNPSPSIQNSKYHEAIFKRDSFICHICGEYTDTQSKLNECMSKFPSIDHLNPQNNGGTDYPTNLKTSCISCNKSKRDKIIPVTLEERSENGSDEEKLKEKEVKEREENKTLRARAREGAGSVSDFSRFWDSYPKKAGKIAAEKAWSKANGKRPPLESILAKLDQLKKSKQWTKDGGQFIPNPATWINQGRWDDEAPSVQADECPGFDWSKP